MHGLDTVVTLLGGLVVLLGLFSRSLQNVPVSSPLVAFIVGGLVGLHGFAVLDPEHFGNPDELLEQASRIVLAIGVMGIALALPAGYLRKSWHSLAIMLAVLMPAMALSVGLLAHFVTGFDWVPALLIGAIVAPTDPILGRSVVNGSLAKRSLPGRLRNLLLAESGANDGLAFPLVFLPLLIGYRGSSVEDWLVQVLLVQVIGAVLMGAALGLIAGRVITLAEDRNMLDDPHFLIFSVALSVLALGIGRLLYLDGILMVFVTGLALARGCRTDRLQRQRAVQDAINEFAVVAIFMLFGMLAPWRQWLALGWSGLALVVTVLVFRRLPWLLLLKPGVPDVRDWRDAGLAGWFGPVGVSALFYVAIAQREFASNEVWSASTLIVAASVVTFALSAPPLVKRYARATTRQEVPA